MDDALAVHPVSEDRSAEIDALLIAREQYERTWWVRSEEVDHHCAERVALRATLLDIAESDIVRTAHAFRTGTGYTEARRAVHASILDRCIPAVGSDVERPAVFFTTGSPGSGKTSVLRRVVTAYRKVSERDTVGPVAVIDADFVRMNLPQYADGLGHRVVEPECYDIAYGPALDDARNRRGDIIFDTIGKIGSLRPQLRRFANEGWDIHILVATAPAALCWDRVLRRALDEDGRLWNYGELEAVHGEAEAMLEMIQRDGDIPLATWARLDTTGDKNRPELLNGCDTWADVYEDVVAALQALP